MASPPTTRPALPVPPSGSAIPVLENGDRLSRDEFERRYRAMPHLKKAELIEGVVHVPSPVRLVQHGEPNQDIDGWLAYYRAHTPLVRGGANATVRLDLGNEEQPDALLLLERGGQASIDEDGYVGGAPDLAVEVAASTASIDLGSKLTAYCRNGVREYIVWRVLDRELDWFILRQGKYERPAAGPDGYLRSEAFPGLWLDAEALINGDLARLYQVLQEGLKSPEHADFVARLTGG